MIDMGDDPFADARSVKVLSPPCPPGDMLNTSHGYYLVSSTMKRPLSETSIRLKRRRSSIILGRSMGRSAWSGGCWCSDAAVVEVLMPGSGPLPIQSHCRYNYPFLTR